MHASLFIHLAEQAEEAVAWSSPLPTLTNGGLQESNRPGLQPKEQNKMCILDDVTVLEERTRMCGFQARY